jgi:hypothetical protein
MVVFSSSKSGEAETGIAADEHVEVVSDGCLASKGWNGRVYP